MIAPRMKLLSASKRARASLEGLSVGDAFGQRFFIHEAHAERLIEARAVPSSPWYWTDDTAMALAIVDGLERHGHIDRDALARAFAERYTRDPRRGYGGTAHGILRAISEGLPWADAAGSVFGGQGSMGNGSAMRVAPIGAWFHDDLDAVAREAVHSAVPTHAHADAHAGAIAVAIGAALASHVELDGVAWLHAIAARTPTSATRDGIEHAAKLGVHVDVRTAVAALGNGSQILCADTVPFALWCAARHLDDFETAMWTTVSGLGDRDTTCAIVGGIVVCRVGVDGIPSAFREAREPLDSTLSDAERTYELG